jgi:hypothetical protein
MIFRTMKTVHACASLIGGLRTPWRASKIALVTLSFSGGLGSRRRRARRLLVEGFLGEALLRAGGTRASAFPVPIRFTSALDQLDVAHFVMAEQRAVASVLVDDFRLGDAGRVSFQLAVARRRLER